MLTRSRRGIVFPRSVYNQVIPGLLRTSHLKGWERVCLFLAVLGRLTAARKFRLLASVCEYVHTSYGEEIRESQAARLAGFSRGGFSRFFHERMGRTFVQIAMETGFNHLSNFNRHFQKVKEMTPREYRRLHADNLAKEKKPVPAPSPKK